MSFRGGGGGGSSTKCSLVGIGITCAQGKPHMGCLCRAHIKYLTGMAIVSRKAKLFAGSERTSTFMVLTKIKDYVFPFPFDYDTSKQELCRVSDKIWDEVLVKYASDILPANPSRNTIALFVDALLNNGYMDAGDMRDVCRAVGDTIEFYKKKFKPITNRSDTITVDLYRGPHNFVASIPLTKLPHIYQMIFYYMEMSTVIVTGAQEQTLRFPYILYIDLATHTVAVAKPKAGDTVKNDIFIQNPLDECAPVSPLVLSGTRKSSAAPFGASDMELNTPSRTKGAMPIIPQCAPEAAPAAAV